MNDRQLNDELIHHNISQQDKIVSLSSIDLMCKYVVGNDRSLVFFVGAGASTAGNTQMPTTQTLLKQILLDALEHTGKFNTENNGIEEAISKISRLIGFEITLNDFWQICREATSNLYRSFAEFEERCTTNCIHAFLAYWLSTGGIVLTTNYDRLIEREWLRVDQDISVRYQEKGNNSFVNWREDINRTGCLFKLHGSLDTPESCLGALEHVTTLLTGDRLDLLAEIVHYRPLCFIGWSGQDPDILPVLSNLYKRRDKSLPIFWIHYEGSKPGSISLNEAIDKSSPLIRNYVSEYPILTDANRTFREMFVLIGCTEVTSKSPRQVIRLEFRNAVGQCPISGVARFVGIAARRAGQFDVAGQILSVAAEIAQSPEERAAAIQEFSLLQQQKAGNETSQSRKLLEKARKALVENTDPWLQVNIDFGMLSMTIVSLKSHPWLLLKLPVLFRSYKRAIEVLHRETQEKESVALHEALLHLYIGRLRLMWFRWLAVVIHPLADWILRPFNIARLTIMNAKDIHIHSRIDVLAYRSIALAKLRHCQKATEDMNEIKRLIEILKDDARSSHWKTQCDEIKRRCQ